MVLGAEPRGELGNGRLRGRTLPTRVGTADDWAQVSAGDRFTCAVKTDGSLWCWGADELWQLGLGAGAPDSVPQPTQVGTDTWTSVSAGQQYACALATSGAIDCWGDAGAALGIGSAASAVPAQVGDATDWTSVSAKETHTCALQAGGIAWCWGYDVSGELGIGQHQTEWSPTRVRTHVVFGSVRVGSTASCGVSSDGALWCWGQDNLGTLGHTSDTPERVR